MLQNFVFVHAENLGQALGNCLPLRIGCKISGFQYNGPYRCALCQRAHVAVVNCPAHSRNGRILHLLLYCALLKAFALHQLQLDQTEYNCPEPHYHKYGQQKQRSAPHPDGCSFCHNTFPRTFRLASFFYHENQQ